VKSVLRKRSRVIDELKGENRLNGEEIERLRKIVDDFDAAHNDHEMEAEDEQEDKAARKLMLDKALRDIDTILTGILCRAAAAQPGIEHGKSTMNALRQEMRWMQQVINGALLADCTFIRQLGHDGGSISRMSTLCISAIITDEDNDNPKHVCLAASELPPGKSPVDTVETIEYTMKEITEKYEMYLGYCCSLESMFSSFKVLKS